MKSVYDSILDPYVPIAVPKYKSALTNRNQTFLLPTGCVDDYSKTMTEFQSHLFT